MSYKKISIISLISFLLIILVDLILGKKIVNLIYVNDKPMIKHSVYHHDLEKNVRKKHTYNKINNYTLCTNNYGFRSKCGEEKVILKKINFAFIGDSFTEGVGLDFNDTFVGLFSNNNKDKITVNLGVESYSPKVYFKKIEYLINEGFEFERIIIFLDLGDIFDENLYFFDEKNNLKKKGTIKTINTIYQDFDNLYKFKKILKDVLPVNYYFYRNLKKTFFNFSNNKKNLLIENYKDNLLINSRWTYENSFSKKDTPWIKNGVKDSKIYLDKIFDLSKSNNFKISLAVYPWPAQIMFDEDTGRNKFGKVWEEYCLGKCEYFINFLEEFHILKTQLGNIEVKKNFYLKDDVHFNKEGNIFIYNSLKEVF